MVYDHGMSGCNYISLAPYYPQNAFPQALQLIAEAAGSEREDELFYESLLSMAPGPEDMEIISSIRDDERKHNRIFRQLYCELTGREVPPANGEGFEPPASYCQGIRRALFGELAAVERYRMILFGLSTCQPYANAVTEIYTDELKHSVKWNYLYCINGCCAQAR